MSMFSAQAMAEAIVNASSYRDRSGSLESSSNKALFTIAMSRQVGSKSVAIAEEVGKRLGWPVYDQALIEKIAQEMNLRTHLLQSLDERRMSWLTECLNVLSPQQKISQSTFIKHLVQTILSLGSHGSCIIVGRGGVHLLPPATTLRVRIVANRHDRICRLSEEMKISYEEATWRLERIDQERQGFIRDNFGKDPTDTDHYDIVLSSSRFTPSECADLILAALECRQNHLREQDKIPLARKG